VVIIGRDRGTRRFFTLDWGRYLEHVASFSLPEEKRFQAGPRRALHLHAAGRGGICYARGDSRDLRRGHARGDCASTYADGTQRVDWHQPVATGGISAQGLPDFAEMVMLIR